MNADDINAKLKESELKLEESELKLEESKHKLEEMKANLAEKQLRAQELQNQLEAEYRQLQAKRSLLDNLENEISKASRRASVGQLVTCACLLWGVLLIEQPIIVKMLGDLAPMRALLQGAMFMIGLQLLVSLFKPRNAAVRWINETHKTPTSK